MYGSTITPVHILKGIKSQWKSTPCSSRVCVFLCNLVFFFPLLWEHSDPALTRGKLVRMQDCFQQNSLQAKKSLCSFTSQEKKKRKKKKEKKKTLNSPSGLHESKSNCILAPSLGVRASWKDEAQPCTSVNPLLFPVYDRYMRIGRNRKFQNITRKPPAEQTVKKKTKHIKALHLYFIRSYILDLRKHEDADVFNSVKL